MVVDAVLNIISTEKTTDIFVRIRMLEEKNLKEWENCQFSYLEKVLSGSLSKLIRVLRILRFYTHDLNIKPQSNIVSVGKKYYSIRELEIINLGGIFS